MPVFTNNIPFSFFYRKYFEKRNFMYLCNECKNEFTTPEKTAETHGFKSPPYESLSLCPICKSTDIEEIAYYCKCCGARLKDNTEYCSEHCRARGREMLKRERKRKKILNTSPLLTAMRAADEYNKTHGTDYSYGQYVAFIEPTVKKIRRGKN